MKNMKLAMELILRIYRKRVSQRAAGYRAKGESVSERYDLANTDLNDDERANYSLPLKKTGRLYRVTEPMYT